MHIKTDSRVKGNLIPNKDGALEILQRVGCSERVIQHCLIVSEYATEIAKQINKNGLKVDIQLVKIGGLLHDIGRSRTHDIKHGIEGACLAREYGLSERLIGIIINHIGAGITDEEAGKMGLPPGNYMPVTLEEKIVAHADNLVNDNEIFPISKIVVILKKKGRSETIIKRIVDLNSQIVGLIH
ncbi:MAG: TIGR00295 family protein [Methanosarcinales archaeon]|nr:TIGR00295 family protein [Methanosarcinales archaeon]